MKKHAFILCIVLLVARGRTGEGTYELDAAYSLLGPDFPLEPPFDYSSSAPDYITRDNRLNGDVDNRKATLGRVLFYDKQLSLNNTIACGSCHIQSHAFGDTSQQSIGFDGGLTTRQSMRLVNTRFAALPAMFWDRRAINLKDQVTQPIQDHIEMGFSGTVDQPGLDSLLDKLNGLQYYTELFDWAYEQEGVTINKQRLAQSLEHFVSSIESFDSRFDEGFDATGDIQGQYSNFSPSENRGKSLFRAQPQLDNQNIRTAGGAGCAGCHRPPEFDINPISGNNGVDKEAGNPAGFDTTNTRSPSLRDIFGPDGQINTPMMHTGNFLEFTTIVEHYNEVIPDVNNRTVDGRLVHGLTPVKLEFTSTERADLEAFIKTLTGDNIYTDERWSSPF
jgi:cytochrome c peroxidase